MRYEYKIRVGNEDLDFSFEADDKSSKPTGVCASGSADCVRTLSIMVSECNDVDHFEEMINNHRGCMMINDEKNSYSSSGMSWGANSADDEDEE